MTGRPAFKQSSLIAPPAGWLPWKRTAVERASAPGLPWWNARLTWRPHSADAARSTTTPRANHPSDDRPRVLNEDVFRTVILREQKRADRFGQPLFLLRVSIDRQVGATASVLWAPIVDALASVKRQSDVVGWVRFGTVLGIVVPEIRRLDVGDDLVRRFRRELETRLGHAIAARVFIRLRVHPDSLRETAALDFDDDTWSTGTVRRATALPRAALYPVAKRACDILGSVTFLLLFLPLLLILAVLVKLNSRGPVLFRQVRLGYKGRPFTLLKFRTMYVDADHALHQTYMSWFIKASDSSVASEDRAPFKMYNDPRVTSVGAFLRKMSFDELPQLWNVLRGEMSLVGPRPPIGYEVDQYEPWHRRRVMDVKPGMTGLWQIAGRSRTTFDQMVRLDLRYAKTRSLRNDIRILFATPGAMISGKGAR